MPVWHQAVSEHQEREDCSGKVLPALQSPCSAASPVWVRSSKQIKLFSHLQAFGGVTENKGPNSKSISALGLANKQMRIPRI